MTPILDRPDDKNSLKYLQEENALLKDACVLERTRTRQTLTHITNMIKIAKDSEHSEVVAALVLLQNLVLKP